MGHPGQLPLDRNAIISLSMAVLLAFVVSCATDETGGESTMRKPLTQTITELDINDPKAVDSISSDIRDNALAKPRKVVELAHREDPQTVSRASMVLLEIGELAFTPLFEAVDSARPEQAVWDMKQVVAVQLANRGKVVTRLEAMLGDTTKLPPPAGFAHEEQAPPPSRVCDEAYLMLRRLLALEETTDEYLDNEAAFFDLTDEERDAEIKQYRESRQWRSLVETAGEDAF